MLELRNVTKRFGSLTAVKELSFSIKSGEIVGLIGENGSGKTTTIKMIAGLYQPNEGKIKFNDLDVVKESDQARKLIGYIPDEPAVYDRLTGDEFLHFIGQTFGEDETKFKEKVTQLKKLFPMEGQTNGYFEDYSRGTRQKFMIIAALCHEPKLLLIDEPIVGLDPASASHATELFGDYVKDKDRAILLCTHTLSVAEKICQRFLVLKRGEIIASGTLAELRDKAGLPEGALQEIYLKLNG
jgi:ABC-2 type transport system ATP-binding protein